LKDERKTKKQILSELRELHKRILELEKAELDQKEIYKSLKENEARYKALFDRSLFCIYIHDLEGNLLDVNETGLRLFGYTREEASTVNILSIISEDHIPIALQRIEEIIKTGSQKKPFEYKVKIKSGEYIWLEVEGALIYKEGKPYAIQGIARNITETKQAAELLKASEAKYRDLYDNAPDMFVSVDPTTAQIIECNQSLANKTGYSKDEIVGRPVFDIYHQDCIEDVKKAFRTFIETGEIHNVELQLKRKDGAKIEVSLNVSAVRDEKGDIIHSRSILRDITDRKQAKEAIRKHEKELEKRVKQLEEFYDMAVGRELRMVELKKEIEQLKNQLEINEKLLKEAAKDIGLK
jgi:PAS domain S-box-containing protein